MYTPPSRAVMQSRRRVGYRWFALLPLMAAALMAFATAPARAGEDGVPKGVAPSDWSSIRAAYEAGRHAATPLEGGKGYTARNPGQRWGTAFDGRGFTTTPDAMKERWSWGLELSSYGREGAEHAVTLPLSTSAQGGRIAYTWDDTLTEWYINDTRGFEHGYTVNRHPAGDGPLRISLAVRGLLLPRVSATGRDVTFVNAEGAAVVNYSNLIVLDADGAAVPARFEQSGTGLRLHVDDAGARYPLTIDPIAQQQAYLKASNTGTGDFFGTSVAVSGDTVVVGANGEDSNAVGANGNQADNSAFGSGAAYVFVRSGTSWTQQAYLKASNTGANDSFGASVAVSGDTVVVGATGEASIAVGVNGNQADNTALNSGAAYVFVRNGTTWTQQAYLKASNTGVSDNFGNSVAVSGDTVVVGAYNEASNAIGVNGNQADNSAASSGAAYVFVRSGTSWTQQAYLKASNTGAGDLFGFSVAASGDTVVVGAYQEDSNAVGVNGNQADNTASASGAAYVFVRSGTSWTQQAYLKASNTGAGDTFGFSVAVSGDTVVVGASQEDSNAVGVNGNQTDNSALNSGAAYVFVRSGTGGAWTQQAYLKASNTGASDNFGNSVAVSGDTVVVGAIFEDSNATGAGGNQADNSASSSGAAYVFVRSGTGGAWTQQAYLKASNTDAGGGDHFGNSVAVSGDTVVVGANTEDSNAVGVIGNQADNSALDSGAGYIFTLTLDLCAGQQPTITQHPSSQSAVATWTLGFTAAATSPSGSSLSYQWQRNGLDLADGGNIAGATTPTLTISPAALTDNGGAYACIVTNSCGSTSTRPAGLAVTTAPHCIADLGSQGGIPGADGFLDNNDFVIFIDAFFNHTGCP